MHKIGIRELKNQATEILRSVRERHTEYLVTYRGEPVALLLPLAEIYPDTARQTEADAVTELARLRPQNRRALQHLEAWLAEPVEIDEAAWQLFEQDLEQQRPTFMG